VRGLLDCGWKGGEGDPLPNDTGTGGTGNPAGTGTGAGTGSPTGAGVGSSTDTGKVETFDAEYVKGLRAEAAKHRTEAVAHAKRVKELEDAQLSDTEKKDKKLAELIERNTQLEATTRKQSILVLATAAGATVPEAIVGLVPTDAEDIAGTVTALKKQFPDLFKKASPGGTADAGGGRTDGSKPKGGMNEFLRRSAGRF
jgi:hypothetical protein